MNIRHQETGIIFDIHEENGHCKLNLSSGKSYSFKESYEALWWVIESIRHTTLNSIDEDTILEIARKWHLTIPPTAIKPFLSKIKKEKIHRTYYDQFFLKLLLQQRGGQQAIDVSSKTNFVIDHEIAFLIRSSMPVHHEIINSVWA